MSKPNDSRGGAIAIRGLLVQTIVALLDITKADPPFTKITLEPMVGDDQFDFLWQDAKGSHAIQVKSTEHSFTRADVERWAVKLQQARTDERCRLVLVGNIPPSIAKLTTVGEVAIETKNLNLDDLVEQAAHRVAIFLEDEKLGAGTAKEREMVVHALESKLQHHSTNATPISRADFVMLLRQWIRSVPKPDANIDISRIIKYAPTELIGREAETALLSDAWAKVQSREAKRQHILTFVALGGEGKTSLVAEWAAELASQNWPGCEAGFAWSFYSQGTRDYVAASSDLFLKEALNFFGDDDDKQFAASSAGPFEKGQRLASIVGQRRALLILDGLEPLQYAPTSPTPGELKDQGIAALLKGLAANSQGLCVVTTRYALPDLRAFIGKTIHEEKLKRLSTEAGVALLRSLGVNGSLRKTIASTDGGVGEPLWNEYEKLVEDVKGHALTLNLLGTYLRDAHAGDIRRRDLIKLEEADAASEHRNHAWHVMDAYVRWMAPTGWRAWLKRLLNGKERKIQTEGKRAFSVLSLLGLFDRPAPTDLLRVLWQPPAIAGLTEPLIGLSEAQRNLSLTRLEDARLLTVNRAKWSGEIIFLDAHPLLREYFARRVHQQQPEAWRAAHKRLYEHLCATTNEGDEPTLEDLQPLYQAVAHGCQAGRQQEAYSKAYRGRITRGDEYYSAYKLGAFSSNLGAIVGFFEIPWNGVSPVLAETDQASLLNHAAFHLRGLGRLTEALEPMRTGLKMHVKLEHWEDAAQEASNLSELELTLGEVAGAVVEAEQSVTYAERSGDLCVHFNCCFLLANALAQHGKMDSALRWYENGESVATRLAADLGEDTVRGKRVVAFGTVGGTSGYQNCDFRLICFEVLSWRNFLKPDVESSIRQAQNPEIVLETEVVSSLTQRLVELKKNWFPQLFSQLHGISLLDHGFLHLILSRISVFELMLLTCRERQFVSMEIAAQRISSALSLLRKANDAESLTLGLLTHAMFCILNRHPDAARADLDEAWEIAERGPMRLHMADIHLHRARLFGLRIAEDRMRNEKAEGGVRNEAAEPYPWESPEADLGAAEKLINKCGYHRRDEELADAKKALLGQA